MELRRCEKRQPNSPEPGGHNQQQQKQKHPVNLQCGPDEDPALPEKKKETAVRRTKTPKSDKKQQVATSKQQTPQKNSDAGGAPARKRATGHSQVRRLRQKNSADPMMLRHGQKTADIPKMSLRYWLSWLCCAHG